MRKEVNEIRERIKLNRKEQFPYGQFVEICDRLAKTMDLLPDFGELKQKDPKLYKLFWDNLLISSHWIYKQNPKLASDLMNEINGIYNQEFELDSENPSCAVKARKFNQIFKYQTNFKL
jgi:hypothetical protein